MPDGKTQAGKNAVVSEGEGLPIPLHRRVAEFARRLWRPAATVVVVALALLLGWHVFNGRNGISVWQQKRVEERQLRKEIDDLGQENGRLHQRVEQLKSDPDAIARVAREKLHYAKPNEVIVTLPPDPPQQTPPAGAGK
jgi:cell division protein FtsB